MDPTACYLDMIAAMHEGSFAAAHELALSLRDWLDYDGFYPPGHAPEEVAAYLNDVLQKTAGTYDEIRPGVPFSLVCERCDDGMHIDSYKQALAEGWSDIGYTPDLIMAYYVGLCPACRETGKR
jgi:hypothetical protein